MTSLVKKVLLVFVVLLTFPALAGAEVRKIHYFSCTDCHGETVLLPWDFVGLCSKCHNDSLPVWNMGGSYYNIASTSATGAFHSNDASNAMGSHPAYNATNAMETSHFWATGTDVNYNAGATSPTLASFDSPYGLSEGKVTCSRCHDPHEDQDKPTLLKLDNSQDAMCLDCHRLWNVSNNSGVETHPIVIDYNEAVLASPSDFNAGYNSVTGVLDANVGQGDVRLTYNSTSGKFMVTCSTCHGVHYTDSDSATVDGLANRASLSKGDGKLLRSDGPLRTSGTTRNDTAQLRSNLCQACHTYEIHGKGSVDTEHQVGCLDCHGGHSYNGGTPNAYILNSQTPDAAPTRPDGVNGGTAIITFPDYPLAGTIRSKWSDDVNGTATGWCEQCHGDVQDPANIGASASEHLEGDTNECTVCHKHNDPADVHAFNVDASAATCGQCHGFPPYINAPGNRDTGGTDGGFGYNDVDAFGPIGYNSVSYFKDESQTGHQVHAGADLSGNPGDWYFVGVSGIDNCKVCHGPDAGTGAGGHREDPTLNSATFHNVPFDGIATTGGLSPVYDTAGGSPTWTCDNVYCHSSGGPRTGDGPTRNYSLTVTTPAWDVASGGGLGAIHGQTSPTHECAFCHGNTATTMNSANRQNSPAHQAHLGLETTGLAFGCDVCHVNTAYNSTTIAAGATDGRSGGEHINGVVNVDYKLSGGTLYNALAVNATGVSYEEPGGTCANYCHDPLDDGNSADWDDGDEVAGTLNCDDCHPGLASDTNADGGYGPITSGSHARHVSDANGPQLACAECHGVDSDAGTHANHVDGVVDVIGPVDTVNFASICEECHGYDSEPGEVLPNWYNSATTDCATCHAGTFCGSTFDSMSPPQFLQARSGGHNRPAGSGNYPQSDNAAADADCESCHLSSSPNHWDGVNYGTSGLEADLMLRADAGFPATYAGSEDTFCDNCHGTADASHPEEATGTTGIKTHQGKLCVACHNVHGDENIQMIWRDHNKQWQHDPSSTGKYQNQFVYFTDSTTFPAGDGVNSYDEDDGTAGVPEGPTDNHDDICATCHSESASPDPTLHNNAEGTGSHSTAQAGTNCLTSCHSPHTDGTNPFGVAAGTACNDCHGYPPAVGGSTTAAEAGAHGDGTNLHARIESYNSVTEDRSDCAWCHTGADQYTYDLGADQAAGGARANHGVSQANRLSVLNTSVGYNSTTQACASACHASADNAGDWTDTTANGLSGDGLACNDCHFYSGSPTAGDVPSGLTTSHDDHFVKEKACGECHSTSGDYNSGVGHAGPLTHIDSFDFGTGADGNDGAALQDMATASQNEAGAGATGVTRTDMTFTAGAADGASPNNTCSGGIGLACHASGTPDWDVAIPTDSSGCVQCHTNTDDAAYNPVSGLHDNNPAGPTITGNSHDGSFDDGAAGTADCVTCHTNSPTGVAADHMNGALNSGTAITVDAGAGYNAVSATCATTCHSAGAGWEYQWTTDVYNSNNVLECNGCHGLYSGISGSTDWTTGTIHAQSGYETRGSKHNGQGSSNYPCDDCHAVGSGGYTFSPWGSGQHGDNQLQLNYNSAHGWFDAGATIGCADSCHGDGASYSFPDPGQFTIDSSIVGNAADVSCAGCHGGSLTGDAGNYWPDNAAGVWGDNSSEDDAGAHGVHLAELAAFVYNETATAAADNDILRDNTTNNPGLTSDEKQKELCTYCHGTASNPIDGTHGDTAYLPADVSSMYTIWSKAADDGVYTNATDSCATTDCHNNRDTDINATPYGWYDGNASTCETCHDPDLVTQSGLAGGQTHLAHTAASGNAIGPDVPCSACHDAATDWAGNTVPATNHLSGALEVAGSVSFTYSAGSCGTNDCHSAGYYSGGSPVAPKTPGYTWGTAIAGCDACHETTTGALLTGSHDVHFTSAVQSITACGDCHAAETAATHYDAFVDFAAGGANYNSSSPESISDETFSTCATNLCHNDGKNATPTDNTYTWNTEGGACNICHDDTATTLATDLHDEHLNNVATFGLTPNCADCHGTGADAGTHSGHVDASVTIALTGTGYTGGADILDITAGTFGSCDTTDCHQDGTGAAVVTPAWNDAPSSADDCTLCHGASEADLTTGSHPVHLSSSIARGPYGDGTGSTDCGECHASQANNTSMGGYATHIDSAIDFVGGDGTLANTTGCDACHGNGSGGGATAVSTAKSNWPSATAVSCESCHGDYDLATIRSTTAPATAGAVYNSVGHGRNDGNAPNQTCGNCHDASVVHVNAALGENRLSLSPNTNFDYETAGQENDYCNDCHTTVGAKFVHYGNSQTSGGSSTDGLYCYTCHDPHGQAGQDAMVRATIYNSADTVNNFTDRTLRSSYWEADYTGICQTCHDGTEVNYFNRTTESDSSHYSGSCIGCHDHGADPGFSASGGACDSCHGSGGDPMPDASHGAAWPDRPGVHDAHMTALAAKGITGTTACNYCHPYPDGYANYEIGVHDTNEAPLDQATMPDPGAGTPTKFKQIIGGGPDDDGVMDQTTHMNCNNIDCHFNVAETYQWYADTDAPEQVTLSAAQGPEPNTIEVSWNAPGDDANLDNTTPYVYDMRFSADDGGTGATDFTIDPSWTNYVGGLPAAYKRGYNSAVIVENLDPASTYYFSLKTRDTAGNWSTASAVTTGVSPTPDSGGTAVAPYFGGPDKALKADKGQTINLFWSPAEDHTGPVEYKVWMVEAGQSAGGASVEIDYTLDTPIIDVTDDFTDTQVQLTDGRTFTNGAITVKNDTIYYLGVRACDANGNCDTNTEILSVTPTAAPTVFVDSATYRTSDANSPTTLLVEDGSFGSTGVADAALPLTFAMPAETYPVNYFADSFAIWVNGANNAAGTLRVTVGEHDGAAFVGTTTSKDVTVSKRTSRVFTIKLVDTTGRLINPGNQYAVELTDVYGDGLTVNYGTSGYRGDLTTGKQYVNVMPQPAPTNNNSSMSGNIANISWNGSSDTSDGPVVRQDGAQVNDSVHYDLYGGTDGVNYPYLIASGVTGTSYAWNAQSDGVPLGSAIHVKVEAGDGFTHNPSADISVGTMQAVDTVAPSPIDDLVAEKRPKAGTVWLTWTAPGDDGDGYGRADHYDIRYSTADIVDNAAYNSATKVTGEPYPDFGGEIQNFEVTGLTPETTYYFAIKAVDEQGNAPAWTGATATQVGGPRCGMCHTTAPSVDESEGNHKLHGFTLSDCDKCHTPAADSGGDLTAPSAYGLDHQDGILKMGYGANGAYNAAILDTGTYTITYTHDGTPTGTVLYSDTNGWGGFGDGTYTPYDDGTDDGGTDNGTCINFNSRLGGGCHGPAGIDPDDTGGEYSIYPTPTWTDIATLDCAACHGDPNRFTDAFYSRQFDATIDAAADPDNPLQSEVPDQVLGSPAVDNHSNWKDQPAETSDTNHGERKYIGQHEKHLNYSFRFSKGDSCNLCHAGNYADRNDLDGRHGNGQVDIQLDENAAGAGATWTPGVDDPDPTLATPGTCSNMSPDSCHPNAATPTWDTDETFECVSCHGMGGVSPGHITDPQMNIDIDNDADTGEQMQGNCTWCHFAGHPRGDYGTLLANSSQVGINYRSGGIHLKNNIGGRNMDLDGDGTVYEAEVCWSCHDSQPTPVSEWRTDYGANNNYNTIAPSAFDGDYDYGQTYSDSPGGTATSRWVLDDSGTPSYWRSGAAINGNASWFTYKDGPIESTHSTNDQGGSSAVYTPAGYGVTSDPDEFDQYKESPDAVSLIRCSNCHDVHDLNKADNDEMTGRPYLRGSWVRNPYREDGAPSPSATYGALNLFMEVPRGGNQHAEYGGFQIDQNNGSPTQGLSVGNSAGLCTLCHGSDIDAMDKTLTEDLWITAGKNGHSNSAIGGDPSSGEATNILSFSRRNPNETPTLYTADYSNGGNPMMGYANASTTGTNDYRGDGFRSAYGGKGYGITPLVSGSYYAYIDFNWGVTQDIGTIDQGYHAFTCSKCHNPHASRLPKLLITNCLDTRHNTWDDGKTVTGNASQGDVTSVDNLDRDLSNVGSAQNCHRLGDPTMTTPGTGDGWNKVSPW